ncbi:MAG: hypothetical protein P8X62_07220 [Flavobacteriaceae bacterium]|jgi:hypothetical protein
MKLKTGFIIVSTMLLIITLFNVPSIFAQEQVWEDCQVIAYGTNIFEDHEVESFTFTTAAPPAGSEIPNTISVMDLDTGENHTITLSAGDNVLVIYRDPINKYIEVAAEAGHYTILYEGAATFISINSAAIPEFSSILIIPMFMIATLLAIAYKKKRTSQAKTTD